ncbi:MULTISPECIES: DUF2785 domain-containing protein [unclassified Clostridium]|uniref:DUF2785 domain-containing protein n=1 Tax=unclassified Clostridium TaxID=2614128 RepID=UPI0025BE87A0|nr:MULTISPECIES: DUF2785 domain-containing protein [unclassified Clostridium]
MDKKHILKETLKEIKNNDFKVSKDLDAFELALKMMEYVGDSDPELRDILIYEILSKWIVSGVFTVEQLKELLNISLDEKHLFYKIGEEETDSVFTRSFSVLIVAVIIYFHRRENFLSESEWKNVKEKTIEYMICEKDIRGYVKDKGWAHSAAHTADALDELAQCKGIEHKDLLDILEAIKTKVCINNYCYVSEEDERMAVVIISVINRNLLNNEEIINWIKSFDDINKTNHYPEDHNLLINIKNFLRSIYFRLIYENNSEVISEAIKETLYKIKTF